MSDTGHIASRKVSKRLSPEWVTISAIYLICILVSLPLASLFQDWLVDIVPGAQPQTIAHACAVLGGWLLSWRFLWMALPSVVILGAGVAMVDPELTVEIALPFLLLSILSPFAFQTMRWAGLYEGLGSNVTAKSWRSVILGSFKTAMFVHLALSVFLLEMGSAAVLASIAIDIAALVIVMTGVMLLFRWYRISADG